MMDMEVIEALDYYREAVYLIRERELREVWLAVSFPAFGNKDAISWDRYKEKFLPRQYKVKPKQTKKEAVPTRATFQGVDLARLNKK